MSRSGTPHAQTSQASSECAPPHAQAAGIGGRGALVARD